MPYTLTRSLLTILVPGLVATAPWLVWLVQHTDATLGADKNATLANAFIFALVVVAGSICEGLGTYMEYRWDDQLEAKHQVQEHWIRYLRYDGAREPVAFRYLSRLVTTMYFELSMLFAVPSFICGSTLLAVLRFPAHAVALTLAGVVLSALAMLYFHYQGKQTHEGICKIRKAIDLPAKAAS
jgi:hypothetical protein